MKVGGYPEANEFVVGTVKKVKNFGAFVMLDEYPGKEGFVHISEVASGWVKHIGDYVRDGQRTVFKVLGVDESKGHIDLSLKDVNEHRRRDKIKEWKEENRACKLMEAVAKRVGKSPDELMEDFGYNLIAEYGTIYAAFEQAVIDPSEIDIPEYAYQVFLDVANENVEIPFVWMSSEVKINSNASDGVERIKRALSESIKTRYDDVDIEVRYLGAPDYMIRVKAPDYKIAQRELEIAMERAIEGIKKEGGEGGVTKEPSKVAAK